VLLSGPGAMNMNPGAASFPDSLPVSPALVVTDGGRRSGLERNARTGPDELAANESISGALARPLNNSLTPPPAAISAAVAPAPRSS
jgi:hypothetical protein